MIHRTAHVIRKLPSIGNGERWQAPLRYNATAFRIQRAKFPARIVAYDAAGRVIDVKTIRGG